MELNLSRALSLCAFAVLAMVWSFILGVFVGRGYNPEDMLPDMVKVLPDSIKEMPAQKILRPEELDFFYNLRSTPAEKSIQPGARSQSAALSRPEPPVPVQDDSPVSSPEPAAAVATYIYSYQVGSFQTMNRAIELQQQLMSQGITASISDAFVNDNPWYRVIVEFESTDQGRSRVMQKLRSQGITEPVFRGRRPS